MKRLIRPILLALLAALVSGNASAQSRNMIGHTDFWHHRNFFLLRVGFEGGKPVRLDGDELSSKPGLTFGVGWDFRQNEHLLFGASADISRMHVADSGQYFFDLALNAKTQFLAPKARVGFRPGISIGYGLMDYFATSNHTNVERTTYMTWKGTFEVLFLSASQNAWFLDTGLMGTAFGGNAEHRMRFGPFPYIRGGLMF